MQWVLIGLLACGFWGGESLAQVAKATTRPGATTKNAKLARYERLVQAERDGLIASGDRELGMNTKQLNAARAGKIANDGGNYKYRVTPDGGYTFATRTAKEEEVKRLADEVRRLRTEIDGLRSGKTPVVPLLVGPLELGRIGQLRDQSSKAMQVVGPNDVLVMWQGDKWLWITGVSTAGVVDGNVMKLPQIFEITGTKTYPSADGTSRTVFVLTPFDPRQ